MADALWFDRLRRTAGDRLRLDFVGMSVSAPSLRMFTPLDADDMSLGLGGAEDHTIYKLRCVARRHRGVFEAAQPR